MRLGRPLGFAPWSRGTTLPAPAEWGRTPQSHPAPPQALGTHPLGKGPAPPGASQTRRTIGPEGRAAMREASEGLCQMYSATLDETWECAHETRVPPTPAPLSRAGDGIIRSDHLTLIKFN